jgi:O-antigen ligase
MRPAVLACSRVALLAGPTLLAFFSGGYFETMRPAAPRLIAGIVAWLLVAVAALAAPRPLPEGRAGRLALAGLAVLAEWTAVSLAWAPLAGPAFRDAQRLVLYLGALIAAAALLRDRRAARAVEPALATGVLIVVGYGISDRLLPGLVHLHHTGAAFGRLDLPLTYWNAMGALAAIGFVLCARLAGDATRRDAMRVAAVAAAAPLGLGIYLSFSRGAMAALGAGLVVLLAVAPTWPELRATALSLVAGAVAALVASQLHGVESLTGSLSTREGQGAAMLAVLVVVMAGTAAVQAYACGTERSGRLRAGALPLPPRFSWIAVGLVVALMAGTLLVGAAREHPSAAPAKAATASRLGSVQTNRYEYWRVALRSFARHPLEGIGSSGFGVVWLRERTVREAARDAHSLYLETAAELGLIGLAALAAAFGGVALCAGEALRRDRGLAAGAVAAAATWALHAGIDWDWEMPAVSLVALVLAGFLIGAAGAPPPTAPPPPAAPPG